MSVGGQSMYLSNDWYIEAAADARRRDSSSSTFLDILTSRYHENMPYSAARELAESKVDRYLKVNDLRERPDLIRDHLIIWGVRKEGDRSTLLPPEIRLFNARYATHLVKTAREKAEREESARIAIQRREGAERAAYQAWLMKDMREWGRENGHFVGTRGRIPRKVVDAYRKAKGI
ncbi:Lsr2 family protein [Streptomyces sp. CS7]|uniref:Lsr2 family protein n=1 Tax=Streptomyces sp. CS-7 TaxID=2906769 RepID=UPI0021B3C08A|nr:Lsr2 family protein [Streptomyces sp. CS-7]MCT6776087.1 Lsr2 family protein [Streptomyces sp. CS-7]